MDSTAVAMTQGAEWTHWFQLFLAALGGGGVVGAALGFFFNWKLEKLRYRLQALDQQKNATAKLGEFVHFVLFEYDPIDASSRSDYARRYWDLLPWLSRNMVIALSDCAADNGRFRGDVRLLMERMRREINEERNRESPERFCANMIKAESLAAVAKSANPAVPQMASTWEPPRGQRR